MIIDPQTAQSIADGSGGQQFIMMQGGGGGVQVMETAPAPAVEEPLQMVMLPNGEMGAVVSGGPVDGMLQDKQGVQYMVTGDGADIVQQHNGIVATPVTQQYVQEPAVSNGHESSMIRIVGIQDRRPGGSVVKAVGSPASNLHNLDLEADLQRQPASARAPRKQNLGLPLSDISQQEPVLRTAVPPGLTGDIFKDTELVEAKVKDLCRRVNLGEDQKEKLRLALMTKGLDAVTVDVSSGSVRVGGGSGRGRGRPRGGATGRGARGAKINRQAAARTIKCDQCKKEFPANVDESVLVHHIKTAHMVKAQEKSTLIQHQAVAHGPSQESGKAEVELEGEKLKAKPEIVKKIADDWDEEDEEEQEKRSDDSKKTSNPANPAPEGSSSESAKEKSEDVDEDQIVADVDDILNDTEDLMGDLDNIASGKNLKRKYSEMAKEPSKKEDEEVIKTLADKTIPTVQCEECYECFETEEKMTWHSLNDH